MSSILKQTTLRENPFFIKDIDKISKIKIECRKPSIIEFENGNTTESFCLKCTDTPCFKFSEKELKSDIFPDFSYQKTNHTCPTEAISIDSKTAQPTIDPQKCISCGICIYRCPTKSIYFDKHSATIHTLNSHIGNEYYTETTIEYFNKNNYNLSKIPIEGIIIPESDEILNTVYTKINQSLKNNHILPNTLVRNTLITLGSNYLATRIGDNNFRMDGIVCNPKRIGLCEVEFGNDLLDSPRNILDDIAVISSRYSLKYTDLNCFIISLELPNKRSEYWRVINDINNVLNIQISSLSIGALLILLWNLKPIDICNHTFYADYKNLQIRTYLEELLERKINISEGYCSILEVNK